MGRHRQPVQEKDEGGIKMKKIISLLLVLVLMLSYTACSTYNEPVDTGKTE